MARTLPIALASILDQIDEQFEIVLVDDGSSDNSVDVIKKMQAQYSNLRLVELQRDSNRKLGFTRNASIREAKGEYVLLHLDCDDVTAPMIVDFTKVFHQIEKALKKDILLSGRPIQMGKRDFLLSQGPYHNIHRGEDRDMWGRFGLIEAYIPLQNKSFKTILPKTRSDKIYRSVYYTFDHLRNDFRRGMPIGKFLYYEFLKQKTFSWSYRLLRFALVVPAWARAKTEEPIPMDENWANFAEFAAYRERVGGSFTEILRKNNCEPDWSELTPDAQIYFA